MFFGFDYLAGLKGEAKDRLSVMAGAIEWILEAQRKASENTKSEEEKKQLYIANVEKPTYPMYQFTRKKDSSFFTTTKILGKYALRSDTLKPSVSLVHFKDKQWISRLNTLKVKISDKGSGIKDYRATIDGEWILMEYNHRKKIATYNFNDKKLSGSKHIFKIVVSDNVGNTNTLSATFYKKQLN